MTNKSWKAWAGVAATALLCSCAKQSGLECLRGYEGIPSSVPMAAIDAASDEGRSRELAATTFIPPLPPIGLQSTKFEATGDKDAPLTATSIDFGLLHTRMGMGQYDAKGNRQVHVQFLDAPLFLIYSRLELDAPKEPVRVTADAIGLGLIYLGMHANAPNKAKQQKEADIRALLAGILWLSARDEEKSDHGILWSGFGWEKKGDDVSLRLFWTNIF